MKGDFEKIQEWFKCILKSLFRLVSLIEAEIDDGAISISFGILSQGLASNNYEVVAWACKVL